MRPLFKNNKTELEKEEKKESDYITRQDLEDYINNLEEEQEDLDVRVEDNKIFSWGIATAIVIALILSIWALALAFSLKGKKQVVFYKVEPTTTLPYDYHLPMPEGVSPGKKVPPFKGGSKGYRGIPDKYDQSRE